MKQPAFEILKNSLTQHRDLVLSGSQVCLSVMKDYGGREHPEVELLAEALNEHIPIRLMHSQPVSTITIEALARELSSKKSYPEDISTFIVACWAAALQLVPIDPSVFSTARTDSRGIETTHPVAQIVQTYASRIKDSHIFFAPNIPSKKLMRAMGACGNNIFPADVLVLIDNTVFGTAKNGALLTPLALYGRNVMEKPNMMTLANINSVHFAEGITTNCLFINDARFVDMVMPERASMRQFVEMLRSIIISV